jgi:Cu/Ag efflux protein CusF
MKTPLVHWQLALALLASMLLLTPSARAAHLLRRSAFQTETFLVASNARIMVGVNHSATLGDLRVGDRVTIGFAQENGDWVAHRITDGVAHKPQSPGSNPTPKPVHHPGAPALAHINGIIRAVDIQAGTVTIAHRVR